MEKRRESFEKVSEKSGDGNDISVVSLIHHGSGSPLPDDKENEEVHKINQNQKSKNHHITSGN